jgi:hypothetical protein
MRSFLILVAGFCFLCGEADARPRNYYYTNSSNNYQSTYTSEVSSAGSSSDQERCQAEANYMASRGIKGHVWGCIGRFEGVGWGSSPNCNTCTPGSGMTCTGDASARGADGWYRVRSWR